MHGVTFDGTHVWFAAGDALRAFDPSNGRAVRAIDVASDAGTAFDGRYFINWPKIAFKKSTPRRVRWSRPFRRPARVTTRA